MSDQPPIPNNTKKYKAIKLYDETAAPAVILFIMKNSGGLVKDPRKAEWILFGLIILIVVVSIVLFIHFDVSNNVQSTNQNNPTYPH
ncbi:MAG: hypothetical protein P4L63_02205 [Candidatus Pacebacteria bacterium]|nr:hypothetical protein [Candidatus Paceibacterota bacterium]